ncbi:nitrate- and nitrite sensing domain-containing protein [Micromonospora sp. NPDC049799]|uniref:sensor histidine kinase n=1 Tax=Micromonospora sp. NPDC049799 TaxID=3154741 RepID=UPI0033CB313D
MASGYLVFQGFYNREVAKGVRDVSLPAVPALASVQQERRMSIAFLSRPSNDMQALLEQRASTDSGLAAMRAVADAGLGNAPDSIVNQWTVFVGYVDKLSGVRSTIDSRSGDEKEVYKFYNDLLDAATKLFDIQARIVPDVAAAQGGIVATDTFRVSDQMSRSGSTIDAAFASGKLGVQDHLEFVRLVGSYRAGLDNLSPHLHPDARERYDALVASPSWKQLIEAENAIIAAGAWSDGPPRGLAANRVSWDNLTRQVSQDLVGLTIEQADKVSARTLRTGNNQLLIATLGSLLALSISVAAILWAVRQSQVLVDQALSVRLAQLGKDATTVVGQLPAVIDRLRRHEKVDTTVDLPDKDYGSDEIGQVADVIRASLKAAAGAAIDEATTRAASMAMLMGIARRPQRPLQHGLRVIEQLQNRIGDERMLSELFDIHHHLAQTRRFLENLIILAGGQIGRRFHNPVSIRRVLLAAFGEAQQYQRITLRNAPDDAALVGQSVTGTIHLLAELLDNALAFSPPGSTVSVTCREVRSGIAVEIEDAGVGMTPERLERANALLATAPTPDVAALRDGTQIGLHVVAALAKRDGIRVTLRTSAYNGLLAIVLLPDRIVVPDAAPDLTDTISQKPLSTVAAAVSVGGDSPVGVPTIPAAGVAALPRRPVESRPHTPIEQGEKTGSAAGTMTENHQRNNANGSRQPEGPAVLGTARGSRLDARPALPLRQPQQHLAPMLRNEEPAQYESPGSTRPLEEVRDRLTQYQRGWAAGRAADSDRPATSDDQGREA